MCLNRMMSSASGSVCSANSETTGEVAGPGPREHALGGREDVAAGERLEGTRVGDAAWGEGAEPGDEAVGVRADGKEREAVRVGRHRGLHQLRATDAPQGVDVERARGHAEVSAERPREV